MLRVLDETWYRELRNESTFYALIDPRQIITLLESLCGGLQAFEASKLPLQLHSLWDKSEGFIPVYLKLMEYTQNKSKQAKV